MSCAGLRIMILQQNKKRISFNDVLLWRDFNFFSSMHQRIYGFIYSFIYFIFLAGHNMPATISASTTAAAAMTSAVAGTAAAIPADGSGGGFPVAPDCQCPDCVRD